MMKDSPYNVCALPPMIHVGHQTEEGVCVVEFDVSDWLDKWPELKCSVHPTRPGESVSYPAVCEQNGASLKWFVSLSDTALAGSGTVEILGRAPGIRKLSATTHTYIESTSTATSGEVPDAARPWVDEVLDAAADAEAAVDKMPIVGEDGNWLIWDSETESRKDSGTPARGPQGEKGDTGPVGTGLEIQGSYASEEELQEAHPSGVPGEAYLIGESLYIWDTQSNAWKNVGAVRGPQGAPGAPGAPGSSVTITSVSNSDADDGYSIVTFSDGSTLRVKNGKAGTNGKDASVDALTLTVFSTSWTGDEAPYTATVACAIAKASNNLVVGAGGALTAEQQAAFAAAMIVCTAQAAGSITLTAFGEVPTIDLPVNVLEVG